MRKRDLLMRKRDQSTEEGNLRANVRAHLSFHETRVASPWGLKIVERLQNLFSKGNRICSPKATESVLQRQQNLFSKGNRICSPKATESVLPPQKAASYSRLTKEAQNFVLTRLAVECVPLLQNVFSYCRMCSLTLKVSAACEGDDIPLISIFHSFSSCALGVTFCSKVA